ncbi:MAG: hypothetical protein EBQ92_00695 [Proteobacteria bacterium]|nr:hypothetical protein [Pseudomonadota bacterium]
MPPPGRGGCTNRMEPSRAFAMVWMASALLALDVRPSALLARPLLRIRYGDSRLLPSSLELGGQCPEQ